MLQSRQFVARRSEIGFVLGTKKSSWFEKCITIVLVLVLVLLLALEQEAAASTTAAAPTTSSSSTSTAILAQPILAQVISARTFLAQYLFLNRFAGAAWTRLRLHTP